MSVDLIAQAAALFAVTNIDDLVLLAVLFGQATSRTRALRVVAGWYVGYLPVLAAALVIGALGARLLPENVLRLLGLLPLVLGLRAAWTAWTAWLERAGRTVASPLDDEVRWSASGPGVGTAAAVSLSNGGDNIGVYAPVFAVSRPVVQLVYLVVFLGLVGVWCAASRLVSTRSVVRRAMARWGRVLLPVVLIGLGLSILLEGEPFGL
jgi:cadmium resistance protein CadD (predicted permease)